MLLYKVEFPHSDNGDHRWYYSKSQALHFARKKGGTLYTFNIEKDQKTITKDFLIKVLNITNDDGLTHDEVVAIPDIPVHIGPTMTLDEIRTENEG